ncbi:MAG: nickel-dependent lactate racemase [Planctomycetota bacterium]
MRVDLPYGRGLLAVVVPDGATVIRARHSDPLFDEHAAFLAALREPEGSLPLRERVRRDDRVAIAISDGTRAVPNERIAPWILEELSHVPRERIVILVGTGSHRPNTPAELETMLGRSVLERFEVVNHDAFDPAGLADVGQAPGGITVLVNARWATATFRIATGFIEPHFFAGFSGGPKAVVPGLAGISTIRPLHSARLVGDPNSTWAVREKNPLHRAIRECAALCPAHFLANVTIDAARRVTGVYAGDPGPAHRAGCRAVEREAVFPVPAPFDVVISTNSGFPLDQNLYQTVKGMTAAAEAVRDGGTILMVSECRDGLPAHGQYAKLLSRCKTPAEALAMVEAPGFESDDQWQVQKQALVQKKARVLLHSGLPEAAVRAAMLEPAPDLQAAIDRLAREAGPSARIAVMPDGPYVVPRVVPA